MAQVSIAKPSNQRKQEYECPKCLVKLPTQQDYVGHVLLHYGGVSLEKPNMLLEIPKQPKDRHTLPWSILLAEAHYESQKAKGKKKGGLNSADAVLISLMLG
jgi:hypothetical protein